MNDYGATIVDVKFWIRLAPIIVAIILDVLAYDSFFKIPDAINKAKIDEKIEALDVQLAKARRKTKAAEDVIATANIELKKFRDFSSTAQTKDGNGGGSVFGSVMAGKFLRAISYVVRYKLTCR